MKKTLFIFVLIVSILLAGYLINPDKVFANSDIDKDMLEKVSDIDYINLGFFPDNLLTSEEESSKGGGFGFSFNGINYFDVHFRHFAHPGWYYIPSAELEFRFLKNLKNSPSVGFMLVLDIIISPGHFISGYFGSTVHFTFTFVKTLQKTDKGRFWLNLVWGPGILTDFYIWRHWDDHANDYVVVFAPVWAAMGYFGPEFYFLSGRMSVFVYNGFALGGTPAHPYYGGDHFYRKFYVKLGIKFHI